MRKILIAPSILSANFSRLAEEIKIVEKAAADWLHIDVMDGHFVPNLTVGPAVVRWVRKTTSLTLDVHLMIEGPWKYVPQFVQAGADILTFHYEACRRPQSLIRMIKKAGLKVGISLRPKTPASVIIPFLSHLDLVLVMTVEPGFGGQQFMPQMLPKIRELKNCISKKNLKCRIEVDGGINCKTAPLTVREGADVLVAGNSIFGSEKPGTALKILRHSVDNSSKSEL